MLAGDYATAVRACRLGLELDRYQDSLWRMLIEAREGAGDTGAASRDRREYAAVLEGLGVDGSARVSVGPPEGGPRLTLAASAARLRGGPVALAEQLDLGQRDRRVGGAVRRE